MLTVVTFVSKICEHGKNPFCTAACVAIRAVRTAGAPGAPLSRRECQCCVVVGISHASDDREKKLDPIIIIPISLLKSHRAAARGREQQRQRQLG